MTRLFYEEEAEETAGGEKGQGGQNMLTEFRGFIYHVPDATTLHRNPYRAVHVVWFCQRADSDQWTYDEIQDEYLNSPWDLTPVDTGSGLSSNKTYPTISPRRFASLSSDSDRALYLVKHIAALDFAVQFTEPYPGIEIDTPMLMQWCRGGRYGSGSAEGEGEGDAEEKETAGAEQVSAGLRLLFTDLRSMVHASKTLNEAYGIFLPYRCAGMMDSIDISILRS